MKKIITSAAFSVLFMTILIIGCSKSNETANENEFIPLNKSVTIEGKNGITVTASDVYSKKSSFRRQIIINDPKSDVKLPAFFITFVSDNSTNIYDQFANNKSSINGEFAIEVDGQVILKKRIENGVGAKSKLFAFNPIGRAEMAAPCNVTTVHDCVAWEIEDMNWVEYGFCLAGAPACYAGLWASCTWEVCHNGRTYVNPNN